MKTTLWHETLRLWYFAFTKVPMIFWLRPKVLELTAERAEIVIPLRRRSQNHHHSMYFGALSVGADLAGGIHLIYHLRNDPASFSFVFKDFNAEFLRRPEADVHFISQAGETIKQTILRAKASNERENTMVQVIATTPSLSGEEPVARFILTLSMKLKT